MSKIVPLNFSSKVSRYNLRFFIGESATIYEQYAKLTMIYGYIRQTVAL
jgi:hypothetical protein